MSGAATGARDSGGDTVSGAEWATNHEAIIAARRNLPQAIWDYLTGGAELETTVRRNRLGFDQLAFRPRVLIDVSEIDPSTTFLGLPLRIPVMLAPIGSLQTLTPDGGRATAQAAATFGTIPFISSSLAAPAFEEIAASTDSPKIFQLYVRGDLDWCHDTVARARAAGYAALCVTVDSAVAGRRERQLLDKYLPPSNRMQLTTRHFQALLTWEMLDAIRFRADLPLIIKGIATAEDARIAVDHGVDVVYVSNHGGRALDHGRATIDILPEVVQAVDGRAEVILDGGVTRGTDVLKALARGVRAVAIGRLQGWGLAGAGAPGLVRVLEILEHEIRVDMALLGTTAVDQIGPAQICPAPAVTRPHETSAFPHLPGSRPT